MLSGARAKRGEEGARAILLRSRAQECTRSLRGASADCAPEEEVRTQERTGSDRGSEPQAGLCVSAEGNEAWRRDRRSSDRRRAGDGAEGRVRAAQETADGPKRRRERDSRSRA